MLQIDGHGEDLSPAEQMALPLDVKPPPVVVDWRTQVPTVSQITRRIRGQLENTFADVWIRGEISNYKKPVSGHAYFNIKDATAQMRAVMFRPALSKLKFQIQDGMEILLHGKITVYEQRGDYQILCDNAEPVGVGALQLAFEQLKQKLAKEGLFDPKYKKKLPFLPKCIGIVTSPTGAAVRDILKVLHRRYPDRHMIIFPASVQGEKAAGEICAAIKSAQRWNLERPDCFIDTLIVGRGGGSLEDMWCFNEEAVARAIFDCKIPVISAVGHEIDFTIADFVADVRAPTPSAAAEIVVPKKDELLYQLNTQKGRLLTQMKKRLEQMRLHVGHLSQRLVDPRQRIKNTREKFVLYRQKLDAAMKSRLGLVRRRFEGRVQVLNTLSPLNVLGRGFSLTRLQDGKILRDCNEVKAGDVLLTNLASGSIESEVRAVHPTT